MQPRQKLSDKQACELIDKAKIQLTKENICEFVTSVKEIYTLTDQKEVLECIKKNGLLLAFVYPQFQADYEVALAAVNQNPAAFRFAAKELKDHRGFVIFSVIADPWITVMKDENGISSNLRKDPEILSLAIRNKPELLKVFDPYQANILYNYKLAHESSYLVKQLFFKYRPQKTAEASLPVVTLAPAAKIG